MTNFRKIQTTHTQISTQKTFRKHIKAFNITLLCFVFGLVGCQSIKEMETVGGSKSDGTIQMAYDENLLNLFGKVEIDNKKVQEDAAKRCQSWGYKTAEAFDKDSRTCTARDYKNNCLRWRTVMNYQCE